MTTPKPSEIWALKNGKTVRVEYFMTSHYLCTILNPIEYGSSRCILPQEFEVKLEQPVINRYVKEQKIRLKTPSKQGTPTL